MDELVHHCIRELSFDGDLGCDVSRLRDFIVDFYANGSSTPAQNVDDAFCSFVWSVILQQPGVRVGIVPEGAYTEVYVAPQPSSKRKAKVQDEERVEPPPTLEIIPDAAVRSLQDMKAQFGDNLRIAVDPETTFVAITGSHFRPPKLTPMVYTALQLVSRGRENGISVVDLSKKTGYDPKTCHYLVEKLLELGYIEKRKKSGVGSNFCIHKYFFDRSQIWKTVLAEEAEANAVDLLKIELEEEPDFDGEAVPETQVRSDLNFDPIDLRHLSSLPLVRARVVKLLKSSPHFMHTTHNLLVTIGFSNPNKTDRRFFATRLRELMAQNIIEKVQVPVAKRKQGFVTCIRLLASGEAQNPEDAMAVDAGAFASEEDEDILKLRSNITLHRQIIDLVAASGTTGITLNELSSALCNFDKRIVELLLARLEKYPPPPHLIDLGVAQLAESHGRERRFRYFSLANFRIAAEREKLDTGQYGGTDFSQVGGFLPTQESMFYDNDEALNGYVDSFKGGEVPQLGKGKGKAKAKPKKVDESVKKLKPRKSKAAEEGKESGEPVTKKGRKRKRADEEVEAGTAAQSDQPNASQVLAEEGAPSPPKKRRGRPPKNPPVELMALPTVTPNSNFAPPSAHEKSTKTPKRGRPPKGGPSVATEGGPGDQPTRRSGRVTKRSSLTGTAVTSTAAPPSTSGQFANTRHDGQLVTPASKALGTESVSSRPSNVPSDLSEPTSVTYYMEECGPEPSRVTDTSDLVTPQQSGGVPAVGLPSPNGQAQNLEPQAPPDEELAESVLLAAEDHQASVHDVEPRDTGNAMYVHEADKNTFDSGQTSRGLISMQSTTFPGISHDHHIPSIPHSGPSKHQGISDIPIDPALAAEDAANALRLIRSTSITSSLTSLEDERPPSEVARVESNKRAVTEASLFQPPMKRVKTEEPKGGFRSKTNISQSRREKEFMRVITDAGGIVNISSKEFLEAHAALMELLVKEGEPVSVREGSRIDKRTVDATLKALESREKIKVISTIVSNVTGTSRSIRVVYLPETTEEALSAFLADVGRNLQLFPPPMSIKTLQEPMEYGGSRSKAPPLPSAITHLDRDTDPRKNAERAEKLFKCDEETVRESLLTEKSTLAQMYGFTVGRAARARNLHLLTLQTLEEGKPSFNVVSPNQRIIHLSHYYRDLSVSSYCSLVACLVYSEDLLRVVTSPEGQQTAVKDLPPEIGDQLAASKSRSQARILDLLDLLRCLQIVVPLQPSESDHPEIQCAPNGEHPTAFDVVASEGWATLAAPQYWRFNTSAPLHLWALSESSPPFWKQVSIQSTADATLFWEDVKQVSTDHSLATSLETMQPPTAPRGVSVTTSRCLRRAISWKVAYSLSWYQTEYLRLFVEKATGKTPLQDEDDGQERIPRIAWIISAPQDVVAQFYKREHERLTREKTKVRRRSKKLTAEQKAARKAEEKALLAQKAAEAKQQRERDWNEMVQRVHPEPLKGSAGIRVRRVRSRFLQGAGTDRQKWEREIANAVEEAKITAKQVISIARPPAPTDVSATANAPPPLVVNSAEKSIEDLIVQQGPPLSKSRPTTTKKKKGKEPTEDSKDIRRRHRFQWTKDYEELARDACAIIKARCRDGKRIDWAALEQVFPAIPRNSVRQRISHLREQPGGEAYFKRLEDKWYDLWMQHRGTDILPDDDPESVTNFNMIAHVKFLRNHIDKNALRVGFFEDEETIITALPSDVEEFEQAWDIVEKVPMVPTWDFLWSGPAEEAREKQFAQQPFIVGDVEIPAMRTHSDELIHVADAALKMALGTPNEGYDAEKASFLLRSIGEQPVKTATMDLLDRGVLTKLVRDPQKSKPGRTLRISDSNQNALNGSISRDLFQDASALEELLSQQEDDTDWREWSLLATDGDAAALIELVSENKIEFKIDLNQARAARSTVDWNSKKADDDDIETAIQIRCADNVSLEDQPATSERAPEFTTGGSDPDTSMEAHGVTVEGDLASCLRHTSGLVDCVACLEEEKNNVLATLDDVEIELAKQVLSILQEVSSRGLTKDQLLAKCKQSSLPVLTSVINRLAETALPLVFWAGYSEIVLVSSAYLKSWSVVVAQTEDSIEKAFPRRWLDITGKTMSEVWDAAIKAVIGVIVLKPGVTQAEIRWKLRPVYDRQEINDVLRHLLDEGYVNKRVEGNVRTLCAGPPDDMEEKSIFWTVGKKRHWYQV